MKFPRTFPDAALCRTRHVDGHVYKCLAVDACRCPYSLAFSYSFYCKHSDCKGFSRKAGGGMPAGFVPVADEPWHVIRYLAGS
jgi:hypothetical protein